MKFISIDQYIKSCPKETQKALQELRQIIRKTIPKAEETISYNIPTYKMNGKYVVYFAGFPKHVSIYPLIRIDAAFEKQIAKYKFGKSTMKFPIDKPLPVAVIKKAV